MSERKDRWSLQDGTTERKGYCRVLLDGMDVCIDVFPFRKGADPAAVKTMAAAIVEVLNAADYWRFGGDGLGPERLEDAVDALRKLHANAAVQSTRDLTPK
jgi:hypothetical protein